MLARYFLPSSTEAAQSKVAKPQLQNHVNLCQLVVLDPVNCSRRKKEAGHPPITLHHRYRIRLVQPTWTRPPTEIIFSSFSVGIILQARRESRLVMTCATTWHRTSWGDDPPFSMIGRRLVNVTSPCLAQQTCGPLPVLEGICLV